MNHQTVEPERTRRVRGVSLRGDTDRHLSEYPSPDLESTPSTRDDVDRHAGFMPQKLSAGLPLYRRVNQDDKVVLEVLLAHMGGPFWAHKDDGAWSIPKGEYESGEDPFLGGLRRGGRRQ